MTFGATVLAATLAVSASDRLAMADRLFNRGDAARAQAEYVALKGETGIDGAELAYRLVISAKALKDAARTRAEATAFLAAYPTHEKADKVRLAKALAGSDAERRAELKILDRDTCAPAIRAEALYRLAELTDETDLYARSVQVEPKGRFAPYAHLAHATRLLKDRDSTVRRQGVSELMDLVYAKDCPLSRDALYLAAVHSYREARYDECAALLRRYQKCYANDARARDVLHLAALSELMAGRFAAAVALAIDETDETLLYVKAVASQRLELKDDARRLSKTYLEKFPQGSNRRAIELQLARLDFEDAVKTGEAQKILAAAKVCYDFSKAPADRLLVGWAYEKTGETDKAEAEYARVAEENPKSAVAADALYRRAMSLLRHEAWSAAELALAEALASGKLEKSRVAEASYWRGLAAVHLGHAAEGGEFLKTALAGGLSLDEQREARLVLAEADLAAGRTNAAVTAYQDLVRHGAVERMSAAKIFAVANILTGETARVCAKALAAHAEPTWRQFGYGRLGEIEQAEGNLAAAAAAWRKCLDEKVTTQAAAPAALRLGLYSLKDGDPATAETMLKKAVDLYAANPSARAEAYLGLAKTARLKGDHEAMKGYATVVVTLFENTKAAEEAREMVK